jgi:hypothetical protein
MYRVENIVRKTDFEDENIVREAADITRGVCYKGKTLTHRTPNREGTLGKGLESFFCHDSRECIFKVMENNRGYCSYDLE